MSKKGITKLAIGTGALTVLGATLAYKVIKDYRKSKFIEDHLFHHIDENKETNQKKKTLV